MRTALGALEPGSDAYAGNAISYFFLYWWSHDFANALRIAQNNSNDAWTDTSNIALPRLLLVAWAQQAVNDPDAAQTYAAVRKTATAAVAEQDARADPHLALAFAAVGLGDKEEAVREGRRASELLSPGRDDLSGAGMLVYLAQIYVRVGNYDAAFDALHGALPLFSGYAISSALLKLDPIWEPIRNDPRFAQLVVQFEQPVDIKPGM